MSVERALRDLRNAIREEFCSKGGSAGKDEIHQELVTFGEQLVTLLPQVWMDGENSLMCPTHHKRILCFENGGVQLHDNDNQFIPYTSPLASESHEFLVMGARGRGYVRCIRHNRSIVNCASWGLEFYSQSCLFDNGIGIAVCQ